MKKFKLTALFLTIAFCMPNFSQGQFLKKLKKRVEAAAEETVIRKAEQKTAQEVDKAMDSLLTIENDENAKAQPNRNYGGMIGADVDIKDVYEFDVSFDQSMEMNRKNKSEHLKWKMFWNTTGDYMALDMLESTSKQDPMKMIFDLKSNATIMMMEKDKKLMAMSMDGLKDLDEIGTSEVEENFTIQKTGRSKEIDGYHCEEYEYTQDNGNGIIWATKDLDFELKDLAKGMGQFARSNKNSGYYDYDKIDGFPIQMTFHSADGKETITSSMSNFQRKKSEISTSGYSKMF